MIPSEINFDSNATPPQWTDNGDQVIEKGANIRIKIKGLRTEVDRMYAIGTIKEVFRHSSSDVPFTDYVVGLPGSSAIMIVLLANFQSL